MATNDGVVQIQTKVSEIKPRMETSCI